MFKAVYFRLRRFQASHLRIAVLLFMSLLTIMSSKIKQKSFSIFSNHSVNILYNDQLHFETEELSAVSDPRDANSQDENSEDRSEDKNESAKYQIDSEDDEFVIHTSFIDLNCYLKMTYDLVDLSLSLPKWTWVPLIPPNRA